jgi:TPR repeat protein
VAADQGDADAQFNLGRMYSLGQGVQQDGAEAVAWYRKSAAQNGLDAIYSVGLAYHDGLGVPQDFVAAEQWYRRAAEHGHAAAQLNLGNMFEAGEGVPQDFVTAHKWFNLAATRFPSKDAENRAKAFLARDRVAAKMTSVQIAEAQRLARAWVMK